MKRAVCVAAMGLWLATSLVAAQTVAAETMGEEKAHHPRIAKAIRELEEAIRYLEAAPHDFGGHKAAAIQDSRRAVEQLKLALEYREKSDSRKGK